MARPLILQDEAIAGGLQRDAAGETRTLSFRDLNNFDIVFDPVVSLRRRAGFANYDSDTNDITSGVRQIYATVLENNGVPQDYLFIVNMDGDVLVSIDKAAPFYVYQEPRAANFVSDTEIIRFITIRNNVYITLLPESSGARVPGNQGYKVYIPPLTTLLPATLQPYDNDYLDIHQATACAPLFTSLPNAQSPYFDPDTPYLGDNSAGVSNDNSAGSILTKKYSQLAQKIKRPRIINSGTAVAPIHPYTGVAPVGGDPERVNLLFDTVNLFLFIAGKTESGTGNHDSSIAEHAKGNIRVRITDGSTVPGSDIAVSEWRSVSSLRTSSELETGSTNWGKELAPAFFHGTGTEYKPGSLTAADMWGPQFFWGNNADQTSYFTQFTFDKTYELTSDQAWIVLEADVAYYKAYNPSYPVCWPCFKNDRGGSTKSKIFYDFDEERGVSRYDDDTDTWAAETTGQLRLFELGSSHGFPNSLVSGDGGYEYYGVPTDTVNKSESFIDSSRVKFWSPPGGINRIGIDDTFNGTVYEGNWVANSTYTVAATVIPILYPRGGASYGDARSDKLGIYKTPGTANWTYTVGANVFPSMDILAGSANAVLAGSVVSWANGIADGTLPTPLAGTQHSGTAELTDVDDLFFKPGPLAYWRDRVWMTNGKTLRFSQRLEHSSTIGVVGDPIWESFPILNIWKFTQNIKNLEVFNDRLVLFFEDNIKVLTGGDSPLNPPPDLMFSDLSQAEGLVDERAAVEIKGMLTFINQYKQVKGFIGREDTMDLSEPNQSIWETFGSKFKSVVYNEQLVVAVDTNDDGDYEELHILDTSRARAFWRKYTYATPLKDIFPFGTQLLAAQGDAVIILAGYPSSNTASEGTFPALAETHPVVSPTRSRWVGFNIDAYYGSATPPAVTMTGIAKDGTTSVNTFTAQNSNDVRAHSGGLRVLSEECRLKLESTGEAADEIRMVTLR